MTSQLSSVPIATRRRASALLGTLSIVLLVAGVLPWTAPAPAVVRVLAGAVLAAGVFGALVASGLARSAYLDARRQHDAELDGVLIGAGGSCDCGHDHHPDGLHVDAGTAVAEPGSSGSEQGCEASAGDTCTHTCDSCVLAGLR